MSPRPKIKYSELNSVRLAYTEADEENPTTLLFIHGLGETMQTWAQNIAGLKDHFHCIAIDLPGHGQSQSGDYPYTPFFFAETIARFLIQQNLNQVCLIGHSLGGQIAIVLAISKPALVDKLILIAPAGFEQFSDSSKRWMRDQAKNYANSMQGFDFASFLPPGYKTSINPAKVYLATINGMIDEPVFDHLKLITQPTLIIFGDEDALIPHRILNPSLTQASVAESGAKEIIGSKLVLFPNAGHYVHIERVGEVDNEIAGFCIG